jgi:uncharacterized protein with NRDE domain
MCLMALALGQSSRWPLVLASNRDEFHDRPALPLSRWTSPDGMEVISGRDMRAGGTWLGCTPSGRLALLTNVREGPAAAGPRSRGELPLRWLSGTQGSEAFLAGTSPNDYAGCNLVMGDSLTGKWTWASNRAEASDTSAEHQGINGWQFKNLPRGLYGLSNALLDTPWPKTLALKAELAAALTRAESMAAQPATEQGRRSASAELQSQLWSALASRQRAARADLPSTGMDPALEHGLSSAWVDLPERGYGTRCSTLVWLEAAGSGRLHLHITEKTWTAGSGLPSTASLRWSLPAGAD